MKKADITELARLGVRSKLEQLERYLADVFSEFPEEFATPTPPVFLKAEEKLQGNSWPTFVASSRNGDGARPASFAAALRNAAKPKARRAARTLTRRTTKKKTRGTPAPAKWGTFQWQRIHDYLLTQDDRTAKLSSILETQKIPTAASAITAMQTHKKLFKRSGPSRYTLIAEVPKDQQT